MAERFTQTYPLPRDYILPEIPKSAYAMPDDGALATAQADNFIRQYTNVTNIENANRAQSLREKEFLRRVVENDRNYELKAEEQNQNIRIGNLNYEINKFSYDKQRENYLQLQDAWGKREEWQNTIDRLAPNGGNSPTYLTDKARAFRLLAKNPADFQVLQAVLDPYDKQYAVFEKTKSLEDEAEVQSAFDAGLLDGEKIGDQDATSYFRDILLNRAADPVSYAAGMRNLKRIATIAQEDIARRRQALIEGETKGKFEAEAFGAGATDVELKMVDGKIVRTAKTPRVYGASRAGTSASGPNVSQISQASKDYIDSATKIGEQITELEGSIGGMPEGIEKTAAEANLAGLQRQQQFYYKKAEEVSSQGGSTAPSGTPAGTGARGVFGAPSLKDVKKSAPQGTPPTVPPAKTSTPAPGASPLESTLSPGARAALGVGEGAVGVVGAAAETAMKSIPGVAPALFAAKAVKPSLEFAESAGSVARELAQYSKNVNRAEKAARERAKKGENFQAALLDEQRKIIEELSQAKEQKSQLTSKL
jgi:hypothetical protein